MKFIWEENDIEPGRRVVNSSGNGEMIIGYRFNPDYRAPHIITLISLDDGLEVFHADLAVVPDGEGTNGESHITARSQVAEWLNDSKATPKTIGLR